MTDNEETDSTSESSSDEAEALKIAASIIGWIVCFIFERY